MIEKSREKKLPVLRIRLFEAPDMREVVSQLRLAEAVSAYIFNSAIEDGENQD